MSRTNERSLSSKAKAIWLSLVSWMHWRRRSREAKAQLRAMEAAQQRLELRQWVDLDLMPSLRRQQEELLKEQLWEMALPLAQALQRMEQQQELMLEGLGKENIRQHLELKELMLETLNSLQEPVEDQIFQQLGQ